MNSTVLDAAAAALRERPEMRYPIVRAHLRKTETVRESMRKPEEDREPAPVGSFRPLVGAVIQRAASLVGWSLKELAGKCDRDPRQVARWIDGSERPHFDVLFGVEELRQPLVVAIAELAGGAVEIETVVRVKRSA